MKTKCFIVLLLFPFWTCFSNNHNGHFFMELASLSVPKSAVIDSLYKWLDIDGNTEFKEIRNEKDELGMLHIAYQQYYGGIPVNGSIVLAHFKNNILQNINGVVMRTSDITEINQKEATLKSTSIQSLPTEIVSCVINGKKTFRTCHKIEDFDKHKIVYVDVETKDTLKILPTSYHIKSTGYTMYNGWQEMNCKYDNNDNTYCLEDTERNILTLYGGNTTKKYLDVTNKRDNCSQYYHTSTRWGGILTNIKITWSAESWWYDLWDANPDFYIKIKDPQGNLLYSTNVIDDHKAPVSWNLKKQFIFLEEGSSIEIYDDDATSDSYGGNTIISVVEPGTYAWSNIKTQGTFTIEADPAIDAHWGMQRVYDFYKEKLGRNGYNNLGTMIYQFIDLYGETGDHELCNAYYSLDRNGIGYMVYGLGDGNEMTPVVALDIMGHEFSHSVTDFNGQGGLEYKSESGALNESFADILGTAIEFYTLKENANWEIGEDVMKFETNIRNMKDPKNARYIIREKFIQEFVMGFGLDDSTQLSTETWEVINGIDYTIPYAPQPDTYKGEHWEDTEDLSEENDNGGVHTNSGVQNYWFYLLSEGGAGVNDNGDSYNVKGIGIDKATQIAYRNLIFYLTPQATYEDAVDGSMSAAKDLYGEASSEQKSVYDAWCAVGLCNEKYEFINQDVNDISDDKFPNSYVKDEVLYILSKVDTEALIYDILGRRISTLSLKANEWSSTYIGTNKIVTIKTSEGAGKCLAR